MHIIIIGSNQNNNMREANMNIMQITKEKHEIELIPSGQ
jgi:hypothetical protein